MSTMNSKPKTLWTNAGRTRYFLADDDVSFGKGNFELVHCSGTTKRNQGKVLRVGEHDLLQYEISKTAAENWAKEQMKAALKQAGRTAFRFGESKLRRWAKKHLQNSSRNEPPKKKTKLSLKNLLDNSTGLESDPGALGKKLELMFGLDKLSEEEALKFKARMNDMKSLLHSIENDIVKAVKRKQNQ